MALCVQGDPMSPSFFRQYKQLKPEFKSISDVSSIVGGALGFAIIAPFILFLNTVTGIDPGECIRCQEGGTVWMFSLVIGMVASILMSTTLVLWKRASSFLKSGEISKSEMRNLLFWKQYPASWLERDT